MLGLLLLFGLGILPACSSTPPPETPPGHDEEPDGTPSSGGSGDVLNLLLGTLPGIYFQPPITDAPVPAETSDPGLSLGIQAFSLDNTAREVGPVLSTEDGSIRFVGAAASYEGDWRPGNSLAELQKFRLEVRLPGAPPGKPACPEGVSVANGCAAFVEGMFRDGRLHLGSVDGEARPVDLANGGSLPVRITVEAGAVNTERVVLTDQPTIVEFGSGFRVEFPALQRGSTASVTVAVEPAYQYPGLELIEWASDTVIIRTDGPLEWAEDNPEIRMTLIADDRISGAANGRGPIQAALVGLADAGQAVGSAIKDAAVTAVSVAHDTGVFIGDAYVAVIELSVEYWYEKTVTLISSLKEYRDSFRPPHEGVFRVLQHLIPAPAAAASEDACETTLAESPNFFAHIDPASDAPHRMNADWTARQDTAIVMIHGWQTLSGIIDYGRPGDTRLNEAHCHTWLRIMSAFEHGPGDWEALRGRADLFAFRYDSNKRIRRSALMLADGLELLRERGYKNIVLLGHSMGGLVARDARGTLDNPDYVTGIVTVGTLHMGAAVNCTATGRRTPEHPRATEQPYCVKMLVPRSLSTYLWKEFLNLEDGSLLDGTFDLTSIYLDDVLSVANPYLERLRNQRGTFDDVVSVHGDVTRVGAVADPPYSFTSEWLAEIFGPNDGIVPVASAIASPILTMDPAEAGRNSLFTRVQPTAVARDHSQLVGGCTDCPDGRNGNPAAHDAYYDEIAQYLLMFTEEGGGGRTVVGGVIHGLSPGNWLVTAFDFSPGGQQPVGSGAPVSGNSFSLDLTRAQEAGASGFSPPAGVELVPADSELRSVTLLLFDDANANGRIDAGETVHLLNDPANTFARESDKYIQLWHSASGYSVTGESQTDAGSPVSWSVQAREGWNRWTYASRPDTVLISANPHLEELTLTVGQQLTVSGAGHGDLHLSGSSTLLTPVWLR